MAVAATLLKRAKGDNILTALFTLTFSGSYATGGDALDFATVVGFTNKQPDVVTINGISGYEYLYDFTNKKVFVFQAGSGATHTHTLHFQTSAAANAVTAAANQLRTPAAAFDVAGVANSAGEGGVVAVATGGAPAELGAGAYPAAVTGDSIRCVIQYIRG